MVSLLIILVVLLIVAWIVSILPLPANAGPIQIKTIIYIILALVAIWKLLEFAGLL